MTHSLLRSARRLTAFVSAQTLVQVTQIVTGIALVRWLSVDEFAQYTLAFGVAATLGALVDVGCSSSVLPLVGSRVRDRHVFGTYLRSALHLRTRVFVALLIPGAAAFLVLSAGHGWSLGLRLSLLATIFAFVIARANFDLYALPLLSHERYREYYGVQLVSNVARFAAAAALRVAGSLTGVTASVLNALVLFWLGQVYKRRSREHLHPDAIQSRESRTEIVAFTKPLVPGIVFFSLQAQITVFLASLFGATVAIAQMGALTRLGSLFAVLAGVSAVIISPRFPQLSRERLPAEIRRALILAAAAGAVLAAAAFAVPSWFLFLLGPAYADLTTMVGWFMLASAISFLAGVIYLINLARKFVRMRETLMAVALVLATQVVCAATLDLGDLLDLQYFALATAVASLVSQAAMLRLGLARAERQTGGEVPTPAVAA